MMLLLILLGQKGTLLNYIRIHVCTKQGPFHFHMFHNQALWLNIFFLVQTHVFHLPLGSEESTPYTFGQGLKIFYKVIT